MKIKLIIILMMLPMLATAAQYKIVFNIGNVVGGSGFFEKSSSDKDSNAPLGETGPGPTSLDGNGDEQAGFYGEVSTSELFTGPELASDIGLTAGTAQNDASPWLKFAYEGKVLYVAKKPYRHSVSWDDIDAVNAVDSCS